VTQGLVLPPDPTTLHRRPAWWFHPLGIETKRARALTEVARHADKLWAWTAAGAATLGEKLALIPGVGAWTVGSVLGPVAGDPDAVPVGDYHFPNTVAWALAGEPRADDDRMLELLAPYRGQRGRVLWAIVATAGKAPAFGPRQRIMPVARW
jgi:3-methyladenine DNA glycosylase/8-oxoguanine DNA glycosylase